MSVEETWRPVTGFPGYKVSDLGRVSSSRRGGWRVLRPRGDTAGSYASVSLYSPDRTVSAPIHRLVAETFLGPPPFAKAHVRHLDGNKSNNRLANLAWGTQGQNEADKIRHGTHPYANRTHCGKGHPYDDQNTSIVRPHRPNRNRRCLTCHREQEKRRRARKAAEPVTRPANGRTHCAHWVELEAGK